MVIGIPEWQQCFRRWYCLVTAELRCPLVGIEFRLVVSRIWTTLNWTNTGCCIYMFPGSVFNMGGSTFSTWGALHLQHGRLCIFNMGGSASSTWGALHLQHGGLYSDSDSTLHLPHIFWAPFMPLMDHAYLIVPVHTRLPYAASLRGVRYGKIKIVFCTANA